jgi:hypothetical protein
MRQPGPTAPTACARSASRMASMARCRACSALILAPLTPSPKMRRLFGPPVWLLQRALPTRAMPLGFEAWNEQQTLQVRSMCNLYSITMNQAAIRNLFVYTIPLAR